MSNIPLVTVHRFGVSLDEQLAQQIQEAARSAGQPVSSWLAEAARRRLVRDGLLQVVEEWEAEHGPLSDVELSKARAELGLDDGERRTA